MKLHEFQKMLAPFRKRLGLELSLRVAVQALLCGAAAGLLMRILSAVLPVKITVAADLSAAAGVFVFTFVLFRILRRPTLADVARRVDAAGFDNRAETCLELLEDTSVLADLQRRDTQRKITGLSPKKISLHLDKKWVAVALCAALLFTGCLFLPNANLTALAAEEKKQEQQEELIVKALENLEKIAEEANLSPEAKDEAREIVEKLKRDLAKDTSLSDKLADINEARDALDEVIEEDGRKKAEDALKNSTEALQNSQSEELQNLGEAAQKGDKEALQDAADALKEKISSAANDPAALEQLKKDLEQAAKEAGETPLGDTFRDLADALKNMQEGKSDATEALEKTDALKKALEDIAKGNTREYQDTASEELSREVMEQLKKQLTDVENGKDPTGTTQSSSAANPSGSSGTKQPAGSSGTQQPTDSSGTKQPAGSSGTTPAGSSGTRQPAGASGTLPSGPSGSAPGEPLPTPGENPGGNGSGGGAGRGEGKVQDNTERIYTGDVETPEGGTDTYVPGAPGEDGNPQKIQMGEKEAQGGTVPYSEVFDTYKAQANEAMDREGIPDTLRDLIEKYFSGLQ